MTRLTIALIVGNNSVYASFYGPVNGKFGLYIGMMDESPSGFKRPRDLVTSEPIYDSSKSAESAAKKLIKQIRKDNKK